MSPHHHARSCAFERSVASRSSVSEKDATATSYALAARSGDRLAAEAFITLLHLDVWRFVAHLSADPQAADDLTQDTFLRALRSLHKFEGRSSARTWLLTIARRTVADGLRAASARPRLADVADWQAEAERAQFHPPGFDEWTALWELLELLPTERRQAFVLTQLLGLPYSDVAKACGCPIGTVRSRVARARDVLAMELAAAEWLADGGDVAERKVRYVAA